MTPEQKQQNLLKHVGFLCDKLNEKGILDILPNYAGGFDENKWSVDPNYPNATFLGGICGNKKAFNFLKHNGYLDKGICWDCGEEPIPNTYTFTDGYDSSIRYFICTHCSNKGRSVQKALGVNKSSNCYIATVCYGDINALEVQYLRNFRDNNLSLTKTGRFFISLYYAVSPYIAKKLKHQKAVTTFIRIFVLDPIVYYISNS